MIKRYNNEPNIVGYKKAASTTFTFNDVVTKDSSGYLVKATASTPRSQVLGLIQRDVASDDTDYADNTIVGVEVPRQSDEFFADVSTGSASDSDVGKRYDLDDENSVNLNSTTKKHVEVVRVLASDEVIVKFVNDGDKVRLVTYEETFAHDDMTDGGGTTGTFDLSTTIPAGAVFERTWVKDVTGFANDTSATIQIGDGSDADRYSTGTPSVFSTAEWVDAGVPSGTTQHTADKTPKVTITTNSDFSSVNAGQATIVLAWYETE